jgi:hypothetical protein
MELNNTLILRDCSIVKMLVKKPKGAISRIKPKEALENK